MPSIPSAVLKEPRLAIRRRNYLACAIFVVLIAGLALQAGSMIFGKSMPAPLFLTVARTSEPMLSAFDASRHQIIESSADANATGIDSRLREEALPADIDAGEVSAFTAASKAVADPAIRWFNGRPIRPARTVSMLVTAYSPDERSCGGSADGVTASGYSVWTNGMNLAAADTSLLPFGSLVAIPGYSDAEPVPVLDRGGRIRGNRLDVLFPTHEAAVEWGAQRLDVVVWEYADGLPGGFRESHN